MLSLVHSPAGLFHLVMAVIALITGTFILFTRKGNAAHKRTGYVYVVTMVLLNGSSFFLYGLFGRFGPFHVAAIISSVTIIFGGLTLFGSRSKNWIHWHMNWMYYSVIGLYAAFASEILTRVVAVSFFGVVGTATALTMVIGAVVIRKKGEAWIKSTGG